MAIGRRQTERDAGLGVNATCEHSPCRETGERYSAHYLVDPYEAELAQSGAIAPTICTWPMFVIL